MATISAALQQHLDENPHIQKVYFDAAGNHYFNVHELDGKQYGRLVEDLHGKLSVADASEEHRIVDVHEVEALATESQPEPEQHPDPGPEGPSTSVEGENTTTTAEE